MFQRIRAALQNHFLRTDIQARAFDSFYLELIQSSYPRFSKEIQNHDVPCYNLLSPNERIEIIKYLGLLEGSLLDYGCGLSFIGSLLCENQNIKMRGVDFSNEALKYNREHYSNHEFIAAHLNLTPKTTDVSHILINDSFYHFQNPLIPLQKLLKSKPLSVYWVHNFKHKIESLNIRGYEVEAHDFTEDFKKLVNSWLRVIQSEHVQEERKIYPLIWDTLENEMKAHEQALLKDEIYRIHLKLTKL